MAVQKKTPRKTTPKGGSKAASRAAPPPDPAEVLATPITQQVATHGPTGRPDVSVFLQRESPEITGDQALWIAIRNRGKALAFPRYEKFIDRVLCDGDDFPYQRQDECNQAPGAAAERLEELRSTPRALHGVDAYQLLKTATEIFLLMECGVKVERIHYKESQEASRIRNWPDLGPGEVSQALETYLGPSPSRLPYIRRIVSSVFKDQDNDLQSPHCFGILKSAASCPCLLELIWSYWHEEGMLVQSANQIALRFQNKLGGAGRNPLGQMAIDPLRGMSNIFWGYIQDEAQRLTVGRRAYEYDHQYGIRLLGKAVPGLRGADSRSKFLEAFHMLLHRAWAFYLEDADTTVVANGFPLLNALKEVHMLLAEGAHNQFGDLPWTARVEMLIQQWIMARPEIQDFLRGRAMVPYKESWMSQVDTMKKLYGWSDVGVTHFRDLAVFGEQVLLSIRYADWIDDGNTEDNAKNWAIYWKPEIQGYIHAYRAATGVDLTNPDRIDFTLPAVHLKKRLPRRARAV